MKGKTVSNPSFKFDHIHIISENPKASADWYVEMFGATIAADTFARRAPANLRRSRRNDDPHPRPAAG